MAVSTSETFLSIKKFGIIFFSTVEKKIIPNFLIDRNDSEVDTASLLKGLKLVGNYLEKTILKPNNLNQPISRLQFINTIK